MSDMSSEKLKDAEAPPPYTPNLSGGGEVQDAPPSYNNIFGGITGVNEVRSGMQGVSENAPGRKAAGLVKICCAIFGTIFCSACYLLISAWPIALIVVGAIHLHNCRLNTNIPVWMIVYGCFSLVLTCISVGKHCCCKKKDNDSDDSNNQNGRNKGKQGGSCCESLILIFLMVWVFVGSSWVFGNYTAFRDGPGSCIDFVGNATNPNFEQCCEPSAYLFAFGSLLTVYSIWGLCCIGIFIAAIVGVCAIMCGVATDDD